MGEVHSIISQSSTLPPKKYKLGYTQGAFDMFHVGHLRLINRASMQCEKLLVGVNSDALISQYKNKTPIIPENERAEIIRNIKSVDYCEIVNTLDKILLYKKYNFNAVFIGDDWKGSARWQQTETALAEWNVPVIYLPYTKDISSTILREARTNFVGDNNENR